MAGTSRFSALPSINIGRSRWNMNHDHPTSWKHGNIIPLDCVRVMPGDTFKLNMASLIRMSQPIVPIMDNIRCNLYAFFVPMRLVWEHTKEFFGENTTNAGPQTTQYLIPATEFGKRNDYGTGGSHYYFTAKPVVGSVSHYLGKPLVGDSDTPIDDLKVSVLKERGYYLIWNEFFRAQQFSVPVSITKDDSGKIGSMKILGSSTIVNLDFSSLCLPCAKQFDYFTSALLAPQYGPSVEIPLGDYAPLGLIYDDADMPDNYSPGQRNSNGEWLYGNDADSRYFSFGSTGNITQGNDGFLGVSTAVDGVAGGVFGTSESDPDAVDPMAANAFYTNFVTDLTKATAASINTLRAAFATQRFLERNNYGTRYHEYIQVHFGVKPPLGLLQVPELIGEHHFNINIQQVLSTAGAADDTSTTLGQPGANSTTGDKCMLFKKAFVEHGYVYVLMTTTHDRHYTAGILRDDLKREELELYHPEFATLGDQATMRSEIQYRQNTAGDALVKDVFGYQEHWAEYRYIPSRASGLLDPYASNGLAMWTLTNTYGVDVALDEAFLYEDRTALAAALVTGNSGPDYIGDFYFNYDVVRPMPLYSIPGRIDHVGGW